MRSQIAGRIDEGLWLFGTKESCVYLLEGRDSSALISAGLSYILPDMLHQMSACNIDIKKIEHLIILHAHFDHVGLAPLLKRRWPEINIYASRRGWEVMDNPKAKTVFEDYTLQVCARVRGNTDILADIDWRWRDDVAGEALAERSRMDLGGKTIEILETPGHSSCSISAYVPELQALFPSDAAAIPYRDEYVIAAGSSFEKYRESLKKMAPLDVKYLCADHYGYVTGDEAARYIAQSQIAACEMIALLNSALQQTNGIEQAAEKLVNQAFARRPDYFVAPEILRGTYTQMLKQFLPSGVC